MATIYNHSWQAEAAKNQQVTSAHENWLIYQAQSFLGRLPTLSEANELFDRIDPNTREPIEPVKPESRLRKVFAWLQ